jgi:dTDP-4-amino-4,6-dideoxygalactose transaminase
MNVPYTYLKDQFNNPDKIFKKIEKLVLKHNQYTFGPELEEFEKNMARYTGVKYCLGTASGTVALSMLLQAIGIGYGDEVITVSQTFVATIGSIVAVGARPYFIDVEDDYTMNPSLLEDAISDKTKAIMPVHYSGNPARMNEILKIANKYNLNVIEDACCAISAKINNKHVGTFGAGGAFSVHPLKNLNVWGDGGFIITNSKEIYDKIFLLRNHGISDGRNKIDVFGYNARLDTIQAIVGNYLFPEIDKITNKRIRNAETYDKAFSDRFLKEYIIIPERRKNVRHVYHMYMILVKHRDKLLKYLIDNKIEAKIHYPIPMHKQKAVLDQKVPFRKSNLDNTEKQCNLLLTLPVHQHLSNDQINYVIDKINYFYKNELWK